MQFYTYIYHDGGPGVANNPTARVVLARTNQKLTFDNRSKAGRSNSFENQSKAGKLRARQTNHIRWHVNRGIVNPECSLCQ